METTKNEMDAYSKNFFNKLGNYLDIKIYYYGSIQRNDYFPGKSDIDVDLFTDNVSSIIIKLNNLLGVEKYKFKYNQNGHRTRKSANLRRAQALKGTDIPCWTRVPFLHP